MMPMRGFLAAVGSGRCLISRGSRPVGAAPRCCVGPSNDAPYHPLALAKSLKRIIDVALFQEFAVFWEGFQNCERPLGVYGEARGGRLRADREVRVVE